VTTVAELLAQGFAAAGVEAFYGEPLDGLDVVPAPLAIAGVLAAAHQRVHGTGAAVHRGGGDFLLGDWPDPAAPRHAMLQLDDAAEGPALFSHMAACLATDARPVTLEVRIAPDTPVPTSIRCAVPAPADRFAEPAVDLVEQLRRARSPVVVAGPEVVRRGCIPGLHALAAAANLGVLNTWGAKGVFDWRSRHHWATVGLQQRDLELGGLGATPEQTPADVVVVAGLDPAETPPDIDAFAPTVAVSPEALSRLSELWSRPAGRLAAPPLRAQLAAVTQKGWEAGGLPLPPTRVTRNYGLCTGGRGLVAADPGLAGFWVARTFATTVVGEALVPGRADTAGFAIACAIVGRSRSPRRPVLAAVDAPVGGIMLELLDHARSRGVPVVAEVWDPDGTVVDGDQHLERLTDALRSPGTTVLTLATDRAQLEAMEAVAGPIVAWRTDESGGEAR
jgi:Thiamine pyrophosphate enzyme, central domain